MYAAMALSRNTGTANFLLAAGCGVAAATFGIIGLRAMTRATDDRDPEIAAELLERIAQTAQAGTFGDARATEAAFALISRQASEALEALGRIESGVYGVKGA